MNKILHITNGDSFTSILNKLPVEGTIITWREMLCEGKTVTDVGSEFFWKVRFDYLSKTYKTTKEIFLKGTLREYQNLCNQKTQDEVVLWFDHDLYSQINMIALLSWLKINKKNAQISVVSTDKKKHINTLAKLPEEELLQYYKNRMHRTRDDVEYADYIWQLYCGNNPIRLETFSKFNSSQLEHLTDAIRTHLLRFPTVKNGLNAVENKVLYTASGNEYASKNELVKQLLQTEKSHGYTNLQYKKIIENLKSLFHGFNPVRLNTTGEGIAANETSYYAFMKNDDAYLGGSRKYGYLYHEASDKLLKL